MSQHFRQGYQPRLLNHQLPITKLLQKHKRPNRSSMRKITIFWGMMTFSPFLQQEVVQLTLRDFKKTIKTNSLASRKISFREIRHFRSMPVPCQQAEPDKELSKLLTNSRLLREQLMFKNRMWASPNHNQYNSSCLRRRISQKAWSMSLRASSQNASKRRRRISILKMLLLGIQELK